MKKLKYAVSVFLVFIFTEVPGLQAESPTEAWVARYNGPGNGYDRATALAVDALGNVYVTGSSWDGIEGTDYATIKYDSDGNEVWAERYDETIVSWAKATALAVDADGNVYVTGESVGSGTGFDYVTIKYNSNGTEEWVKRYNGPGEPGWNHDYASALAVDALGNVYVTGSSEGSDPDAPYPDYATIKYNSNGTEEWVKRYNGPGNSLDEAKALAVDDSGNVYVTGESVGSGTGDDYLTIKYDSAGVAKWVARYNGPGNNWDAANDLAVDDSGNVYVTGFSYDGSGTQCDYATIKYNSAGEEQWVARYNGPGNESDWAFALAVDALGNVYVTGSSATIKYNSAGEEQWVARYNGPGNSLDEAKALVVDGSGNVYATGVSWGSGTWEDYATIKYNSDDGEQVWVERYNGPGNGSDEASALAVDDNGNVYVTGFSYGGSGTHYDYATIKYAISAIVIVEIDIKPGDWPNSINLGSKGVIPVAILSSVDFDATQVDPSTVTLAGSGVAVKGKGNTLAHQEDVNGDGLLDLVVQVETENLDLGQFQDGEAILNGQTYGGDTIEGSDEISIVPPEQAAPAKPASFALQQIYPNPLNPDTWIPYQLAEDVNVTIRIYNVSGRIIRILELGHKPAGFYTTREKAAYWDGKNEAGEQVASGIYFCTLQAGEFRATKKVVVAR